MSMWEACGKDWVLHAESHMSGAVGVPNLHNRHGVALPAEC